MYLIVTCWYYDYDNIQFNKLRKSKKKKSHTHTSTSLKHQYLMSVNNCMYIFPVFVHKFAFTILKNI